MKTKLGVSWLLCAWILWQETVIPIKHDKRFCPWLCGNSYFRYPSLKNFFHKSPITNDLEVAKAYTTPFQAAFNRVTCFKSCQPSIRRMWI